MKWNYRVGVTTDKHGRETFKIVHCAYKDYITDQPDFWMDPEPPVLQSPSSADLQDKLHQYQSAYLKPRINLDEIDQVHEKPSNKQ